MFLAARRALPAALVALLALVWLTPALAQDRPVVKGETGRTLDEYLSRLERFGFTGGALAVRGKDLLLSKSCGLADRAQRLPLTTDSVYNLGSIARQFAAAAILTLEMQGKLRVTDLAGKYLDGVPPDKAALPPRVVDVAPDRLSAFAGEWRLPRGGTLTLAVDGSALSVTPAGQEAFSALAAAAPAQAVRLADLAKRTADIAAKSSAGDVTALYEAVGGGMPLEEMRAQEADMMRDRESRLGK